MKNRTDKLTATFLPLILAAFFSTHTAVAQSSAGGGTIQGAVKDETGAIIPGAKVKITHLATGRVINSETNSEGFFATPPVDIGKYKIHIEAAGMKAWEGQLIVETGRVSEVSPKLTAGEVSETVIIEGNITPLVSVSDPTEGSTLDSKRISELPINGRNLNTLLESVAPGVEAINDVNGGVRIGGMMVYSTNYTQDGASTNNREFGGSGIVSGLESIGEVKIEASSSSAKYTTPTSVIITTRGGGNQFHGSLYETHRNNAFGVARARQDVLVGQKYEVPKLIRNEFGGSISGPVYLPRFGEGGKMFYDGHNRTFFFFSREGVRLRQGITRQFSVPTMAMRNGDFSGLLDSLGRLQVLYDPLTTRMVTETVTVSGKPTQVTYAKRDPFPNNQIPLSRISPLAKYMFSVTQLPNDVTNPLVSTNLKIPVATNAFPNRNDDPMTLRIDHRISEKDNAYFKVNGGKQFSNFIGTASNNGAPTANNEANVTYLPMQGIAGALSWTHTFSSTFFVETLFNRTWQSTETITGPPDAQQNWSEKLGLPNYFDEIGWPNITNIGLVTNYTYIEGDNRRALHSILTNLEQNYTLIRGTHNIQFGGSFSNDRDHLFPDQGAISGSAYFNSLATAQENPASSRANPGALAQTGYDTANFFLGYAARYDIGLKRGYMQVYEKKFGFYFQDNWKVSNRLTVNPGLRWDINPAFHERNGQLSAFDVKNHALLLPEPIDYYYKIGATTPELVASYENVGVKFESAADVGKPKNLFRSNLYDFSPRAGFAYRLWDGNKQMVIRGGYGIYTSAIPMRTLLAQFSGLLPFRATFQYNPNSAAFSPDGIQNYLMRTTPTIISGVNSGEAVPINSAESIGVGQSAVGLDENQPSLRIHEWNLAIEKQLSKNTVIRFTYNGKHGVNSDQLIEINPQPNDYVYYTMTQKVKPTGPTSGIALRIYDQTGYGSVRILQKTGYINSSTWTAQIERRFSSGLGFQAFYTLTNSVRQAGNSFRDDVATVYNPTLYLPGTVPTDNYELNRTLFYDRDTAIPKHRVRWNWNYDLPFGKGQKLLSKSGRFINGLAGGWKFSGTGTLLNTWYALPTNNWGEFGKFEVYGKKYKILDCRATPANSTNPGDERCTPGYLWFNGYISPQVINRTNAAGLRTGVFGIPDNYKPAQKPIIPWGTPGALTTDYDTNVVYIPLINSNPNANCDRSKGAQVSCQRVSVDTGYHPWRNQYMIGPYNWVMDASLLKVFTIKERVRLRVNFDLFNVFNIQGLNPPNAEGIVSLSNSFNPNNQNGFKPRQIQGTLRLEW
ncbi:MAG: TonB-dependent receptor [Chloracidobacterium sp.]|nr:TonB-dependent receptor [Chloracidobacterium sp.]